METGSAPRGAWGGLWLLRGIGFSCITTTVWAPAVAIRFHASRGLAIAIMLCANGISIGIMPILATLFMENFGWRGAFVGCALVVAAISIPLVFLLMQDTPRAARKSDDAAPENPLEHPGMEVGQAMLSSVYIRIALSAVLFTIGTVGLVVYFVPILRASGMAAQEAAAAAGGLGGALIVGRLGTGILLDRMRASVIAAVSFGLPSIACLVLLTSPGPVVAAGAGLIIGLAMGSELDVVAYASTRYFGLKNISAIYGTLVGMITFASGIGPMATGAIFDLTGSYDRMVLLALPCFVLASLLMATLPHYPAWNETPPGEIDPARLAGSSP